MGWPWAHSHPWPNTLTWVTDVPGLSACAPVLRWPPVLTLHPCDSPFLRARSSLENQLPIFLVSAPPRGLQPWLITPGAATIQIIQAIIFNNRGENGKKNICHLSIKLTLFWTLNLGEVQVLAVPVGTAFKWKQHQDMNHLGTSAAQIIAKTYLTFLERNLLFTFPK